MYEHPVLSSHGDFFKLIADKGHEPGAMAHGRRRSPAAAQLRYSFAKLSRCTWHLSLKDISSRQTSSLRSSASTPTCKDEVVGVAAHLDGYGYGTPVNGDNLYNGTLDDAAYVALLIQMADDIKAGKIPHPKRSILFCAFTGEEKGLLGSNWFVDHPTVPKESLVADINLDQLRPLYPLNILTAERSQRHHTAHEHRDSRRPGA